jgi:hypothetical protein
MSADTHERGVELLEAGRAALAEGKVGRALDRAYDVWNLGDPSHSPALLALLDQMRPALGRSDQRPFDTLYPSVSRAAATHATLGNTPVSLAGSGTPQTGAGAAGIRAPDAPPATAKPVMSTRPELRPAVDMLVVVFWIAAILSVIGGLILGLALSRPTFLTPNGDVVHGPRDGSVVFAGIVGGILTAALWAAMAAALRLLAEIADSTRRTLLRQ